MPFPRRRPRKPGTRNAAATRSPGPSASSVRAPAGGRRVARREARLRRAPPPARDGPVEDRGPRASAADVGALVEASPSADAPWAAGLVRAAVLALRPSGRAARPRELLAALAARSAPDAPRGGQTPNAKRPHAPLLVTVKTTARYRDRLDGIRATWLRDARGAADVVFVTDDARSAAGARPTDAETAGVRESHEGELPSPAEIILAEGCGATHADEDLCCKTEAEFGAFYERLAADLGGGCAVGEPPTRGRPCSRYDWFCHFDDDMYVFPARLASFLERQRLAHPRRPLHLGARAQGAVTAGIRPALRSRTDALHRARPRGAGARNETALGPFAAGQRADLRRWGGAAAHSTGMYRGSAARGARLRGSFVGGRMAATCRDKRVADDVLLANLLRSPRRAPVGRARAAQRVFAAREAALARSCAAAGERAQPLQLRLPSNGCAPCCAARGRARSPRRAPGELSPRRRGLEGPGAGARAGLVDRRGRAVAPNFCRRVYGADDGVASEAEGARRALEPRSTVCAAGRSCDTRRRRPSRSARRGRPRRPTPPPPQAAPPPTPASSSSGAPRCPRIQSFGGAIGQLPLSGGEELLPG